MSASIFSSDPSFVAQEARMYWLLSTHVRDAVEGRPGHEPIADMIDEMEVLHDMSEWPALKARLLSRVERLKIALQEVAA